MKKIKPLPNTEVKGDLDLPTSLQEHRLHQFITQHGLNLVYALLALIAFFILMFWLSTGSKVKAEKEYSDAESNFTQLQKNIGNEDKTLFNDDLAKLKDILKNRPELNAKYDGPLAQALILQGNPQEAEPFATLTLKRNQNQESPFYTDYSETTLLVAQKQYAPALANSIKLKQKLIDSASTSKNEVLYGDTLQAMNLIRIATLQQQLGNKEDELAAWQEFQSYAKKKLDEESMSWDGRKQSAAMNDLLKHFAQGNVMLFDYIEMRKKELNN